MPRPNISLNFMPAFYAKHAGLTYGEAFYFDPSYRASVERVEQALLHDLFGAHGVGSTDPEPSADIFFQPIEIILRTQGAEWVYRPDATLESQGTPWAGLSVSEIAALDAQDAANHPVVDAIIAQYDELRARYGDRADILGLRGGTMTIHTPYTTAQQLCGEDLFILLATDPEGTRVVLEKVWEIYQAVFGRFTTATNSQPQRVHLGDCAASLLGQAHYRQSVLPVNQMIAGEFSRVGYHSCGSSSHLLEAFAQLRGLDAAQLGPGTDLAAAARLMPGVVMEPLFDPVLMRDGTAGQVQQAVAEMVEQTATAPAVNICAWSFDRDTPFDNVHALYEAVAGTRQARR